MRHPSHRRARRRRLRSARRSSPRQQHLCPWCRLQSALLMRPPQRTQHRRPPWRRGARPSAPVMTPQQKPRRCRLQLPSRRPPRRLCLLQRQARVRLQQERLRHHLSDHRPVCLARRSHQGPRLRRPPPDGPPPLLPPSASVSCQHRQSRRVPQRNGTRPAGRRCQPPRLLAHARPCPPAPCRPLPLRLLSPLCRNRPRQ